MKTFKLMLSAALLTVSVGVSAQFANTTSKSSGAKSGSSVFVKDCNSYGRFSLSYSPLSFSYSSGSSSSYSSDDDEYKSLHGFRLSYLNGISVSKKLPFFVEVGADLSFNTRKYSYGSDDDYKIRSTNMAIAIPIQATYKLAFNNGVYLAPYFGLHFKLNVLGQDKETYEGDYSGYDEDETAKWFKDDDYSGSGDEGYGYKRFQFGWQTGLNVGYKKFNFNIGYSGDSPIWKSKESYHGKKEKLKTGSLIVGIGVNL